MSRVLRLRWMGLLLAWVGSRAILTALTIWLADLYLPDVYLYATWARILVDGQFPVGDPYWQYPPGAGALFALSALIPPDPVNGFIILALVADAAILALLVLFAHWTRPVGAATSNWWGPWAWVVGGIAIGPIMLARFDLFPTVFAVAALVLIARPWGSGVAAGIGALLKAWPALMLLAVPRRELPKALAAAAITGLVGVAALMAWAPGAISFLGGQQGRGLEVEATGALPYLLGGMVHMPVNVVLRFGSFEVLQPGTALIGTAVMAAGLLVIGALGVLRLVGRLEQVSPGDVALAAVLVSVATSRVFSPQYTVWLVGVAIAAAADPRSRLRQVAVLLMAMSVVTQAVFPWLFGSLLNTEVVAVLIHTIRIVLLWLATIAALGVVIAPARCQRWPVIRRLVRPQ